MRDNVTYRGGKRGGRLSRMCSLATMVLLLVLTAQLTSACTGPSVNEEPNTVAQERTAGSATVDEILSDPKTSTA